MKLIEAPVKERPIIFSTTMVRAILEGRKTQTRRAIKFPMDGVNVHRYDGQDENGLHLFAWGLIQPGAFFDGCFEVKSPYKPGDVLWVRETWRIGAWNENGEIAIDYKADDYSKCEWLIVEDSDRFYRYWNQCVDDCEKAGLVPNKETDKYEWEPSQAVTRWRPSIHMPREAARLFLRVTDVRVERVQDITLEDAHAEGVCEKVMGPSSGTDGTMCTWENDFSLERFEGLWESLNAKRGFGWDANPWVWVYTFERIELSELQEV